MDKMVEAARRSVEDGVRMAVVALCFGWIMFSGRIARDAARLAEDAGKTARKLGTLIGK